MHSKKDDIGLSYFLYDLRGVKRLSPEEEKSLFGQYKKTGDLKALHTILTAHTPLLVKIAKRIAAHSKFSIPDLIQEGMIGMRKALDCYDPNKGASFSTYARVCVKTHLQDYMRKNWSIVKVFTTSKSVQFYYHRHKLSKLMTDEDRDRVAIQIGDILNMPKEEVLQLHEKIETHAISIEQCLHPEHAPVNAKATGTADLERVPEWLSQPAPQDKQLEEMDKYVKIKEMCKIFLEELLPQERFVIEKRYLETPVWTLTQIGKELGFSRQRAHELERRAMRKIREMADRKDKELLVQFQILAE